MPLKFAFSTVACPEWTIEQVAEQASKMGYQGVELATLGAGSTSLACDPAISEPEKIRRILADSGIEPICLSTTHCLQHGDSSSVLTASMRIGEDLAAAAEMGCPAVRVFGLSARPGENRRAVLQRIGQNVAPLAEKAGTLGIELLFENSLSSWTAKEWWWLLDIANHPMVGMSWSAYFGAVVDINDCGGWISVSVLNSRIRLAKVADIRFGEGAGFVPLGEGDVGIENFLKRLRGVGFEGYVSVDWPRTGLRGLTPPEQYLPDALNRLQDYMAGIDQWIEKGQKTAERAAAKNAPKSRAELKAESEKKKKKAAKAG